MPITGSDIRCPRGVPGSLVSNIGIETMGKGKEGGTDTRNRSKGTDTLGGRMAYS
jgi:hypothetical protein